MTNWYNEPEFQDWQYLISYDGAIFNIEIYYKFEEYPAGYIRVNCRDEVRGAERCTENSFATIEEAREYVDKYEEKLNKLVAYEQELDFY